MPMLVLTFHVLLMMLLLMMTQRDAADADQAADFDLNDDNDDYGNASPNADHEN